MPPAPPPDTSDLTLSAGIEDLRVALLGYGLSGRVFHGPLLAVTPGMRVTAIVTRDAARRAQASRDFPQAPLLTSADDVWRDAGAYDLVVVATSTPSHVALALQAIAAGLHVVVEKPLAPTAAQARRVASAAREANVVVVPFLNRRWDSDHLTLRRLLRDGELGDVLRYESRFERWRPQPSTGSWREKLPAADGGGVLLDLGAHLVDQALALHGPVGDVHAEINARRRGADDDVFLALQHTSGVISHLWASALAAAPGPRLRVLGSRAAFVVAGLDGQEDALRAGVRADDPRFGVEPPERWGRLRHGDAGTPVAAERGAWTTFYAALAACLRSGAPPPVTAEDAIAGLEILDAARALAR